MKTRAKQRKPSKVKSPKIRAKLKPRQQKLLEGLAAGKSVRKAGLEAGYSEHTVAHPGDLLNTKAVQSALAELLAPIAKIAQRINEGLDAQRTEFAKFEGRITHSVNCVDFGERRQYAELATKLKGLDPSIRVQHEGEVTQRLIVEWEEIGA